MYFKWEGTEKNQELFKNIVLVVPNPMIPSTEKGYVGQQQQHSLVKQRNNETLKNMLRKKKKGHIPMELKNTRFFKTC